MELKPGYRQTELGVIPEDWNVVTVGVLVAEQVIEKPLDGNHGNIHPKSSDYVSHGIPFVMANNVYGGRVDLENCRFISKKMADSLQKGFSVQGDVLLTHKGTVGHTAIVEPLTTSYIMLTPQVTYYRVRDTNRLDNRFLRQYFDSDNFQSLLANLAGGGTRAYIGIVGQLSLPVLWPPIEEQRAIAAALSDMDALIQSQDVLITKKRDLKQAAMQQLLTGKQRLPGFSGEWEVKRLGELAQLYQPTTISADQFTNIGFPVYGANGVVGYFHRFNHESWQTTVTCRGSTCGVVNKTVDYSWITGNAMVLNCDHNKHLDKNFFYHLIKGQDFSGCITGSGQPQIVRPPLQAFKISLPSDKEEQTAIAGVLSDMDAEIAALEAQRDKTRVLKQGMMQVLLTGQTRLV